MKKLTTKLVLLAALISFGSHLQAQVLIGTKLSYKNSDLYSEQSAVNTKQYYIAPEIAFSMKPNQLLGFRYAFSKSKINENTNNSNFSKTTTHAYSIFNRHRKYINKYLNFYGEIAATYSHAQTETDGRYSGNELLEETKNYLLSLAPGIEFKLTSNWQINTQWGILSYRQSKNTVLLEENKVNYWLFQLDPSDIQIGLNYIFESKEKE